MASLDDLEKASYAATLGLSDAELSQLSISDIKLLFFMQGRFALFVGPGVGSRMHVQPTDPGGAAEEGDLWVNTT